MTQSRLPLVLDGAGALPDAGTLLVFGPKGDADLAPLPAARLRIVQGFHPDHEALAARGLAVTAEAEGAHAAALVFLPRARAEGRAMLAEAAARVPQGAPIWIDGQKTDGIDTMLRDLRALAGEAAVGAPVAKAHGKIFRLDNPGAAAFAGWRATALHPAPGFVTRAGVFSAEAVDRGSALLAAALPETLSGRIADLGAGWGWLSAQILTRPGVRSLDLIEADHAALACARANISDPRASFHWADATRFAPAQPYDAVVTNPPFHQGRAADPALGAAFIAAAARMLAPHGRLWLVANRHLPYEAVLTTAFREVAEVGGDGAFKLFVASHPQRLGGQRPGASRAGAAGAAATLRRGTRSRR